MQHIVVVCGAGASSTFLAHWMRRVAADRSLDVIVSASSAQEIAGRCAADDIVLVGSHLAESFAAIGRIVAGRGGVAVQLPTLAFDIRGAAVAIDLAQSARPHHLHPHNESETTHG